MPTTRPSPSSSKGLAGAHTIFKASPRVFVSYASQDHSQVAKFVDHLTDMRFRVWWDAAMRGGENWSDTINSQLSAADAVLIFWSQASVSSPWVRIEANHARQRNCLVPIRLDDTELPDEFRLLQTIDARSDVSSALDDITSAISEIVRSKRRKRYGYITGSALATIVLLLIVMLFIQETGSPRVSTSNVEPESRDTLWNDLTHAVTDQDLQQLESGLNLEARDAGAARCVIQLRRYQLSRRDRDLAVAEEQCKLINNDSDNADDLEAHGWLTFHRGNYDSATSSFSASLEKEPARLGSQLGLAVTYDFLGQVAEAERAFADVAVTHPGSWRVQNASGAFFSESGQDGCCRGTF